MTLFIAFLVIYGLEMNAWLYLLAVVIWGAHLKIKYQAYILWDEMLKSIQKDVSRFSSR